MKSTNRACPSSRKGRKPTPYQVVCVSVGTSPLRYPTWNSPIRTSRCSASPVSRSHRSRDRGIPPRLDMSSFGLVTIKAVSVWDLGCVTRSSFAGNRVVYELIQYDFVTINVLWDCGCQMRYNIRSTCKAAREGSPCNNTTCILSSVVVVSCRG